MVKGVYLHFNSPVQITRERAAQTQYDREGFEVPRFQNSGPFVTDKVTDEVKYGKVKRRGIFAHRQIQKGEKEEYCI